jgi:hypothetical protein
MRLIDLGSKSGKWADIAADQLGWVLVWQDEATGDLVLCQLHPDGSRRVSDYRESMGRDNGFPRIRPAHVRGMALPKRRWRAVERDHWHAHATGFGAWR